MLLPLSTDQVRDLQLKHHMALTLIASGLGDQDQIAMLLNVVYLAFFLRECGGDVNPSLYKQAELLLLECAMATENGVKFSLEDDARLVLEKLLISHDSQLAAVPRNRYVEAWKRMCAVTISDCGSPIPVVSTQDFNSD